MCDIKNKSYRIKLIKLGLSHPFVFDEIYNQTYGGVVGVNWSD